jgi:hypothetical protein
MQSSRIWWGFGLVVLVGCGGNFTQLSDQVGGAAGASAGGAGSSAGAVGHAGTEAKGGSAENGGYGAYGGDIYVGGYGGDIYVGGYGGNIYVGGSGGGVHVGGYGGSSYGGGYGGDISVSGYGGDAGAAGAAGTCGSTPLPANPYPVKFVFNAGYTVYVRQTCTLEYQLYGCASTPVARSASCVADCSDTSSNGCIACGACPILAKAIGPSAPLEDTWNGESYTYGTLPSGCACASGAPAPAGTYSLSISVFSSAADAMSNVNGFPLSVQFTLPAVNNVVTVDLFQGV